MALITTDIPN